MKKLLIFGLAAVALSSVLSLGQNIKNPEKSDVAGMGYKLNTNNNPLNIQNREIEGSDDIGGGSGSSNYVTEIEDGAVYRIVSAANNLMAMSVVDNDIKLKYLSEDTNQYFTLSKDHDANSTAYYSITPLTNDKKIIKINSSNKLVLQDNYLNTGKDSVSYTELNNKLKDFYSYEFYIASSGSVNEFKISLGLGRNNNKYVTTNSHSTDNNTPLIQRTLDGSHTINYHWHLQKVNYLGINVKNKVTVNGTSNVWFNINVPVTSNYVVQTGNYNSPIDTTLSLYNSSSNLLASNDNFIGDYSRITYRLQANTKYQLALKGKSINDVGDVYMELFPEKTMLTFTNYSVDSTGYGVDEVVKGAVPAQIARQHGIYSRSYVNVNRSELLNKTHVDGRHMYDEDYLIFFAHGYNDGKGVTCTTFGGFYETDLSSMLKTELAVWCTCGGGKPGGIADYCTKNLGVKQSIAWDQNISVYHEFNDNFWRNYLTDKNAVMGMDVAIDYIKTNCGGDPAIIHPILFTNPGYAVSSPNLNTTSNLRYFEETVFIYKAQKWTYNISFQYSGRKAIQTFGELDTKINVYYPDGTILNRDDEGFGRNALAILDAQANTTYVVEVLFYYTDTYGRVKVSITPFAGDLQDGYSNFSTFESFLNINTYPNFTWYSGLAPHCGSILTWTPPSNGNYTISLESDGFDNYLYVIDPASVARLKANVDYNDDSNGRNAAIRGNYSSGKKYYIVYAQYNPAADVADRAIVVKFRKN